ncbi:MAG: hypothetical protein KIS66_15895 [Fimbriimonadaceae bacterium]|nr:hypothetical protein [Fimbriimonadaceae bacterium]
MVTVASQPSYVLRSDLVEGFVSELGGHLGPVRFRLGNRPVEPYSVAPWHGESLPENPAMLRVLRGDFFCLPFGGNESPFRGESHPPHGETANKTWKPVSVRDDRLVLSIDTTVRPGRVVKTLELRPGETVVYQTHRLEEMAGPMCLGHHAMLKPGSVGILGCGPYRYGQVYPGRFEEPRLGGYSCLLPGALFDRLSAVPSLFGTADLARYPAREGFEDLAMLVGDPAASLGWSTLALPEEGYLWFALRDPATLTNTVLWHSNGGRHYAPWNGRHRGVLGIEDVTAYFHEGLAPSATPNPVSDQGGRTCLHLRSDKPTTVRCVQGVVAIPADFAGVRTVVLEETAAVFEDAHGRLVRANLDGTFLSRPD